MAEDVHLQRAFTFHGPERPKHRSSPHDALGLRELFSRAKTSKSMEHRSGRAVLRQAFRRLEHEVPGKVARVLRSLRHPDSRWVRIPAGLSLILGGIFSILPFLGLWMLPLGLLLIAYDVPVLQKPVGRFTLWAIQKWASFRQRFFPERPQG
jgi:hypothetical protein